MRVLATSRGSDFRNFNLNESSADQSSTVYLLPLIASAISIWHGTGADSKGLTKMTLLLRTAKSAASRRPPRAHLASQLPADIAVKIRDARGWRVRGGVSPGQYHSTVMAI